MKKTFVGSFTVFLVSHGKSIQINPIGGVAILLLLNKFRSTFIRFNIQLLPIVFEIALIN